MNTQLKKIFGIAAIVLLLALAGTATSASAISLPTIQVGMEQADEPDQLSSALQVLLLLTVLTLAPSILIMMTSFTRIVIVLSFLRQAMGTQQTPPTQVLIGLALFLSMFVMTPVWNDVNKNAFEPFMEEKISQTEAFEIAQVPLKRFMLNQIREKDLALFVNLLEGPKPAGRDDVQITALIPAFIISELKTAFQIGFMIYIPFLILDMVVASVLLSMGMLMLPPVLISLPFKLMLFVMVDGWYLTVGSLMRSFN